MQVQTVFIVALLVVEEELTKLGGAERRANHPIIEHVLVHGQDGNGRLACRVERKVGRVRGAAPCGIVHVFGVDDDLL